MQRLFAALRDKQADTDRFIGTITGTVPIPEFFAPQNFERIIGRAAAAPGSAGPSARSTSTTGTRAAAT